MKKTFLTKTIFVAFLLAAVSFASYAQIRIGVRAGANLARISGDDDDDNAMKFGFHVGGMVHIPIQGRLCFQPEVLFSGKGTQSKEESDYKLSLNYVDIPILFNYRLENGIYVEAGPTVGVLVSAKTKFDGDSEDVKDSFKASDIGAAIGAGYRADMGFSLGIRYQLGISNIADDDDFSLRNNVLMFTIGYLFGEEHE